MTDALALRASDRDREDAVGRLRDAMQDGRLTMDEYMDRVGAAYQAVTSGDLAGLLADLPAAGRAGRAEIAPAGGPRQAPPGSRLPVVLRFLWTIWLTAVLVNVVVWALVSTTGHVAYPWPLWVAGPYGAALFAVSAAVTRARRAKA